MLYFSYGSNLHLAQMARRCPKSSFKGKATLPGYKWQINERGVANVVTCIDGASVEGLLYSIGPEDENALDLSEGVSKGFYDKCLLRVMFEPHPHYGDLETLQVSQMLAQSTPAKDQTVPRLHRTSNARLTRPGPTQPLDEHAKVSKKPNGRVTQQPPRARRVNALVYISDRYTANGPIRVEYIARMQSAVADALALGVSQHFVDKYISPCLKHNRPPSPASRPSLGTKPAARPGNQSKAKAPKRPAGGPKDRNTTTDKKYDAKLKHDALPRPDSTSSSKVTACKLTQGAKDQCLDSHIWHVDTLDATMEIGARALRSGTLLYAIAVKRSQRIMALASASNR